MAPQRSPPLAVGLLLCSLSHRDVISFQPDFPPKTRNLARPRPTPSDATSPGGTAGPAGARRLGWSPGGRRREAPRAAAQPAASSARPSPDPLARSRHPPRLRRRALPALGAHLSELARRLAASLKVAFRVVHFSVQRDHVRLVVEGDAAVGGAPGSSLASRRASPRWPSRRSRRSRAPATRASS
jgi:hypothetical protein